MKINPSALVIGTIVMSGCADCTDEYRDPVAWELEEKYENVRGAVECVLEYQEVGSRFAPESPDDPSDAILRERQIGINIPVSLVEGSPDYCKDICGVKSFELGVNNGVFVSYRYHREFLGDEHLGRYETINEPGAESNFKVVVSDPSYHLYDTTVVLGTENPYDPRYPYVSFEMWARNDYDDRCGFEIEGGGYISYIVVSKIFKLF